MMPFYMLAVGLLIIGTLNMAMQPLERLVGEYTTQILRGRLAVIGAAIDEEFTNNPAGGYLSPAAIAATPGYEYLNSYKPGIFKSQVANSIDDSVWRFSRLGIWFQLPYDSVDESDYIQGANNECGSDDFDVSQSWCGRSQSIWFKLESRRDNSVQLLSEKQRMFRVISKFYRRYSADRQFSTLANGASATLASLAGYAGVASGCAGVYVYQGIPLTCDDMFNAWGNRVVLNQISKDHIALVNRTGIINSNGQPIRLAEEAVLE